MNQVNLVGRLVRDPDVRYSAGENATAVARFAVAVNRKFKNAEGTYDADFPNCTAFGKTAEFISKYFHKGDMIGLNGEIRTGSYVNKDGNKVYTTDVNVTNVEFVGGKTQSGDGGGNATTAHDDGFMNIPDNVGEDGELPF